jgi:alcohol dehydrogenase (cytochrome c)
MRTSIGWSFAVIAVLQLPGPVRAAPATAPEPTGPLSFTQAQATTGRSVYIANCASCHGDKLEGTGAAALSGPTFLEAWANGTRPATDLFSALRQMPKQAPGSLSTPQYLEILSYLLAANGFAPGPAPLSEASLHNPLGSPVGLASTDDEHQLGDFPRPPVMVATASGTTPAAAELAADSDADWLMYNHDYTGKRYSRLTQINVRTAAQLQPVCMLQLGLVSGFQSSPLFYRGIGYVSTPRTVHSFNATDCKLLWTYKYEVKSKEINPTNRGLALYEGKLFRGTTDGHLLALDATNGQLLWDVHVADSEYGYWIAAAPIVVDGKVIVGLTGADWGIKGRVYAFDANTGQRVWAFDTIPTGDQPGADTWAKGAEHGGGSTWSTITFDPMERLVFAPIGNPGPDFDAAARPGSNLYTNSIVALHVDTGELSWYVQQVRSDNHDWDTAAAPVVYEEGGRRYMAVASKDGWLYIYDRSTHALVARSEISSHENVDVPVSGSPVHICPGFVGGAEWNGPAYDPQRQALFVNSVDWCATIAMESKPYVPGGLYSADKKADYDPIERSRGWLRAFEAKTGRQLWAYAAPAPMVAGVTPTAGGVILTGGSNGDFLVFDSSNGKILYQFNTGGALAGGVSTYSVAGRQYVAVASGNHGAVPLGSSGSPTVVLFALPDSKKGLP